MTEAAINLLPISYQARQRQRTRLWVLLACQVLILMVGTWVLLDQTNLNAHQAETLANLTEQTSAWAASADGAAVALALTYHHERQAELEQVQGLLVPALMLNVPTLSRVLSSLPQGMHVYQLTYQAGEVVLNVRATTVTDLPRLIDNLSASGYFSDVHIAHAITVETGTSARIEMLVKNLSNLH